MDALTPWHLLILAGVFVLLFGAKRLPDAARSLGKSARILKTELRDIHEPEAPAAPAQLAATPPAAAPAPAQPVVSADQTSSS